MKNLLAVVRYAVGGLFIFSGLIKINDPVGTAIKMEEYFAVFAGDFGSFFSIFEPYALIIAVTLNILEVVLGLALILRWKLNLTLKVISLLIIFFTFLTFYSAYFNKVTDCGCFGDAIKLTPWESFTKDVILVVLIGFLFSQRSKMQNSSFATRNVIMLSSTAICLFLSLYAIRHLPYIDFRAYKEGTNIPQAMQAEQAPIFEYTFEKDGKEVTSREYLSADEGYEYVGNRVVNPEKSSPKIIDFSVWNESGDKTEEMFEGNQLWIIIHNAKKSDTEGLIDVSDLLEKLSTNLKPIILTSAGTSEILRLKAERGIKTDFYYADGTVLKTIIRSNPGLVLVKEGTIVRKWHYNDVPNTAELNELL